MGLLDKLGLGRLAEGLSRTRENLVGRITTIVSTRTRIDEELLSQLEEILIGGDVGLETSLAVIDGLRARVREEGYTDASQIAPLLKQEIRKQFPPKRTLHGGPGGAGGIDEPAGSSRGPRVMLVVGINGVGKTTTIGKLAYGHVREGRKVVIAAADTFRAAANEQLEIWARRAGAEIIRQEHGSDPAAVAFDSVQAARARGADVVLVDTAGRLHTKVNLMEELRKITRVVKKLDPSYPHDVLLVIDASTGQNGLQQAKQFSAAVGVTGIVLTKLDGTAKGGIVLAISRELQVPVEYIGVGEKLEDLQPFDPDAFVEALFAQ